MLMGAAEDRKLVVPENKTKFVEDMTP